MEEKQTMFDLGRELSEGDKAKLFDEIMGQVLHWSNCPLEEVDAQHYQGRCGRMGYEARGILRKAGAIKVVETVGF